MQAGDNIILMLDGNEDMQAGPLKTSLEQCQLWEVISDHHGPNDPSTVINNTSETLINGIWCNAAISIKAGGYLPFEALCLEPIIERSGVTLHIK
jgi:hypothetical protein